MVLKTFSKNLTKNLEKFFKKLIKNSQKIQEINFKEKIFRKKIEKFQYKFWFNGWRNFINKKIRLRYKISNWFKDSQIFKIRNSFLQLKTNKNSNLLNNQKEDTHRLTIKYNSALENHQNILESLESGKTDFFYYRQKRIQSLL